MNNISNFLTKPNISMIWDVISDEDIFKFLSRDIQSKIADVFTNNLKGFYDNEIQKNITLIDLNKKYILLMLSFIKTNYPQQPNKITILEEISPTNQKKLITYEEIHNDRQSQFEKDLSKRQEEFTSAITLKVPPVPDFNDKLEDGPITEMEKIIKEMTAQRNYEVEQINHKYIQDDTWLKSQETSIKNEKFQQPSTNYKEKNPTITNTKLKYLKIDSQEDNKRNVTWGENATREFEENEIIHNTNTIDNTNDTNNNFAEENIFKKLKRIETKTNLNNTSLNNTSLNSTNNEEFKQSILTISNRLGEMQKEMTKMQEFIKTFA